MCLSESTLPPPTKFGGLAQWRHVWFGFWDIWMRERWRNILFPPVPFSPAFVSGYLPVWDYCRCPGAPTPSAWPGGALTMIVHRKKGQDCSGEGSAHLAVIAEAWMRPGIRGPAFSPLGSFLPPGTRPFLKGARSFPTSTVSCSSSSCLHLQQPRTQECSSPFPTRMARSSPFAPPQIQGLVGKRALSHHARCCPGGLALILSLSMRPHKADQYRNL